MSTRPVLKKQESLTETPHASKAEFEAFFGFVESQFSLIERAIRTVNYEPGTLDIHEKATNVNVETMKSTIANSIASENRLTPRLRDAILHFFVEPPVMNSPASNKISVHTTGNNRLEDMLLDLQIDSTKKIVIAVSKVTYAISFWNAPPTETDLTDDPAEFRFAVTLSRQAGETNETSNWDFRFTGSIDIRHVDTALYTKLESEFDKNFHAEQTFTPSAITALSKPREAIYDTVSLTDDFTPVVNPKPDDIRAILLKVVKSNVLFKSYTIDEQKAIVGAFESSSAAPGDVVIRQGDEGAYFYVIESGEMEILLDADGLEVQIGRILSRGDYFGELALMYNTPRAASVRAVSPCRLWRIDRRTYRSIVTYFHNIAMTEHTQFVRNVEIHGTKIGDILKPSEVDKVVSHLETEDFGDGSVIVRQGNTGDNFYIIKAGNVAVWQQQMVDGSPIWVQLTTLHKGDFFGEKALLKEDVRQASCIALGDVTCLSLNRQDFIEMLGSWKDKIAAAERGDNVDTPVSNATDHKEFRKNMTLDDLTTLRTLGQGAFGRVKLCQHKTTGETFALKCQSKKAIVRLRIQDNVINEMRLMRMIEHERIGKLYCALQDTRNIYFVLELLQGGEFFTYLQKVGRLSEAKACFYAASVVSAYTALHELKIAYRDLKPENMVLDAKGFVKIVDLGLAKQIQNGKTWTMCGTPDYLAPEIILNEGHDMAVDYWALGVLIYEMVTGWPPFYADEPMKTYEKIVACAVSFPVYITRQLSDLVSKLLTTQPGKRLGNLKGGINDIMKHKWFASFDWAGLDALTIPAPYVPTIKDATDVSNFDNYDDEKLPEESTWVADLS